MTVNGRTAERVRAAVESLLREVPGARVAGVAADLGRADGCAALIAYVCSAKASATTGATLRVDGGGVRAIP